MKFKKDYLYKRDFIKVGGDYLYYTIIFECIENERIGLSKGILLDVPYYDYNYHQDEFKKGKLMTIETKTIQGYVYTEIGHKDLYPEYYI